VANISCGVHTRGLRLSLVLHSEDGDTHSAMSDNYEYFKKLAARLQERAVELMQADLPEWEHKR
jgi:hypothetical protein